MPLTRLIYVSRPRWERAGADFIATCDAILASSRRANAARAVTGSLLASRDRFAQVLEGRRAAVSEVFARICRDMRHGEIELMDMRAIDQRRFGDWTMSFCDMALICDELVRRFRHGRELDLASLSPTALLAFMDEAARAQAADNFILGAPRPRIDMPDDIAFTEAAE